MRKLRKLLSLFVNSRYCPFCGWRGFRFEPFGNEMLYRKDAQCPICGSLERHRVAFVLLRDRLKGRQRVLHVAPERIMIPWLVSLSREYLSVDLCNPAMEKMDLQDLDLPDQSKTLVWCSHVLEHVPNDRKALKEILRVLEPGGRLILQVPIGGEHTVEDPSTVTPEERLRKFYQEDHVRLYGRDLKDRLEDAGFSCTVVSALDIEESQRALYAVDHPVFKDVYLCERPS